MLTVAISFISAIIIMLTLWQIVMFLAIFSGSYVAILMGTKKVKDILKERREKKNENQS